LKGSLEIVWFGGYFVPRRPKSSGGKATARSGATR